MYDHTEYLEYVRLENPEDLPHVEQMLSALDRYARSSGRDGVGDFLQGVILGDLDTSVAHADATNQRYLALYMRYCYNQLPSELVNLLKPVARVLKARLFGCGEPLTRAKVEEAVEAFVAVLDS